MSLKWVKGCEKEWRVESASTLRDEKQKDCKGGASKKKERKSVNKDDEKKLLFEFRASVPMELRGR